MRKSKWQIVKTEDGSMLNAMFRSEKLNITVIMNQWGATVHSHEREFANSKGIQKRFRLDITED